MSTVLPASETPIPTEDFSPPFLFVPQTETSDSPLDPAPCTAHPPPGLANEAPRTPFALCPTLHVLILTLLPSTLEAAVGHPTSVSKATGPPASRETPNPFSSISGLLSPRQILERLGVFLVPTFCLNTPIRIPFPN